MCCVLRTCLWGRVEGGVDLCAVCCGLACGEEWREEWTCVLCVADLLVGKSGGRSINMLDILCQLKV